MHDFRAYIFAKSSTPRSLSAIAELLVTLGQQFSTPLAFETPLFPNGATHHRQRSRAALL